MLNSKGITVSKRLVRTVLRKELNLKYGKIKRIAWLGNSERSLVLR